jgi:hypothetical protein
MGARNIRNYSESLLRAILLRAVAPREWGIREQQSVSQLLVDIYRHGDDAEFLSGEILLATARGALDRSAFGQVSALLKERHDGTDALLKVLATPEPHDAR